MVRTILAQSLLKEPEATPAHTLITFVAADTVNGNRYKLNGNQILLARNSNAVATSHTVTLTSGLLKGRSKTLAAITLAAGDVIALPRFPLEGWKQTDGYVYVSADHAEVLLGVLDLSAQPNA